MSGDGDWFLRYILFLAFLIFFGGFPDSVLPGTSDVPVHPPIWNLAYTFSCLDAVSAIASPAGPSYVYCVRSH
ncbi:hypothetical protein DFH08DRAFT_900709 [Mycena albidolilacea]|uniref:Uncharacterized protein n=1 Tax=Mycena albidolilacea TaxID=1033008 RepID=A0AAD6Z5X0_9AGAR|nr:hypothetical protein DFH08DRAFT_900709 [Mycena albidolilacea]